MTPPDVIHKAFAPLREQVRSDEVPRLTHNRDENLTSQTVKFPVPIGAAFRRAPMVHPDLAQFLDRSPDVPERCGYIRLPRVTKKMSG